MAQKRMFSLKIVDSDAFLDMSQTAQTLYFHLVMRADDDGFVGNPKKIMRIINANDDDYKILIAKRFILVFPEGICVIKHWWIHNTIMKDRYHLTQYQEQLKTLKIKDNGAYTEVQNNLLTESYQNDNKMLTQTKLNKTKLKETKLKETNTAETSSAEIPLLIKEFETINPAVKRVYGNKTQRKACEDLIETYGFERVMKVVRETLPKTNKMTAQFFPNISTPLQLFDKWQKLEDAVFAYQEKKKIKNGNVIW